MFHTVTNNAYNDFTEIFSSVDDKYFPKKKIKFKPQKYRNIWKTKGVFKKKHKLYQKVLKRQKGIRKFSNGNKNCAKNFLKTEMKKMRSYINLTKVILNPVNVSLKVIIRVKY